MKKLYAMIIPPIMRTCRLYMFAATMLFASIANLNAQSGNWDAVVSNGAANPVDHGNGVQQLLNNTVTACVGAAVHETTPAARYAANSTAANPFDKCYYVFFACPGGDAIGADSKGDGMAFSFWRSSDTYNINNGLACGGGLGYMGAVGNAFDYGNTKMLTIEFDTYSSQCTPGGANAFDCRYGTGTTPGLPAGSLNDELSLQQAGNAQDQGVVPDGANGMSTDAGNLEDGKEHKICIKYTPATNNGLLEVRIDDVLRFSKNLGATYNFNSYFGSTATLNQTWSAGQNGAKMQAVVHEGGSIFAALGGPRDFGGGCILPVTWLSFTGKNIGGNVVLNWGTSMEKNNQKFIVERSDDNFDWEPIGEIAGAGNASTTKNYSFTDTEASAGVNYYRIRQVDFDGKYDFSSVVAVSQTAETSVSIAPNPFTDILTIRSSETGVIGIKIHDILGKLVYQGSKETSDGIIILQPELLSGTYLITIQTETSIKQEKIIKY